METFREALARLLTFRLDGLVPKKEAEELRSRFPYALAGKGDRILLVAIGTWLGRIDQAMMLVAILSNLVAILRGYHLYSVARLSPEAAAALRAEYTRCPDHIKNVYSPAFGRIFSEMSKLSRICRENGIDFICEFIPGLDVFEAANFEQGIFRHGLPSVYQMAELFRTPAERKGWQQFHGDLTRRYAALDDEYLELVRTYWDDGQLFENTAIAGERLNGGRFYYLSDRLNANESVLTWD